MLCSVAVKCPSCQHDNVYTAAACAACGYAFQGPQTNYVALLASIDHSAHTIKTILQVWCVLAIFGVVILIAKSILSSL